MKFQHFKIDCSSSAAEPSIFISIVHTIWTIKLSKSSFPSIENNRPLVTTIHNVSKIRYKFSGRNNVFLIDWSFKWTLRRARSAFVYSWTSGECYKPTSAPRAKAWWGSGAMAWKIFLLLPTKQKEIST